MRRSIRRELPLSYAAIALLAALALGAVLLLTLRDYYRQVERGYLSGNAEAFATLLAPLLEAGAPDEAVQSQVTSLSFLAQARVRLLDLGGAAVADSGTPDRFDVALAPGPRADVVVRGGAADEWPPGVVIGIGPALPVTGTAPFGLRAEDEVPAGGRVLTVVESLPLSAGRVVFQAGGAAGAAGARSGEAVRQAVVGSDGALLGAVELSEGPAYGREIVGDVARGWALAGAVAVGLAAVAGWWVSRRITAPLLALTEVTSSMAGGDLSARAPVARPDEFGALARSFNGMAGRIEATVQALRRFASDAAHELRTPLATLRTNLEMMEDGGPGQGERLARAQAQVRRLEALTAGLLDLSRLEAAANGPGAEPVSLPALLREAGEAAASQAEQAGLAFELALPEGPVAVRGDAAQLRQAVANLLDNACKFTPEGGRVTLGLRREGAWAEVWVEDTGIGVPEDEVAHLFERFHRGRNSAAYPGSGLGLAIVKAIAGRHGGSAGMERTPAGSRFWLRLPAG